MHRREVQKLPASPSQRAAGLTATKLEPEEEKLRQFNSMRAMMSDTVSGPRTALWWALEIAIVSALVWMALHSRLYEIDSPNFVSWDEAHFGKFAGWYVKREFFFDVHPPLGKMTLGLIAYLTGFDGKFDFESAKVFPPEVPYAAMRTVCATISALTVPAIYITARQMGMSRQASILSASMIMFDMANVALGRLILIDALLFLATLLVLMCLAGFRRQHTRPFSLPWWLWLFGTGLSLGIVSSVKWIGLFVVAVVGLYTIGDLWILIGSKKVSVVSFCKHFGARALCLIALPIAFYIGVFVLHFSICINSGPGDAYMPSLFQASLRNTKLGKGPEFMAYGAVISIRNNAFDGALLHSHIQTYPAGSRQQQVTTYPHHDHNNYWFIVPMKDRSGDPSTQPIQYVRDGDIIVLRHNSTRANLHSHPIPAPVSKIDYEVSGYGNDKLGDENDHWRIEFYDDMIKADPDRRFKALSTRFRLRHVNTGCLLWSHAKVLPDWGFKQHEATCHRTETTEANVLWNMEENINNRLPNYEGSIPKFPFWDAFMHLNAAMWHGNNALTTDPTKVDDLTSPPSFWPFLTKGIRMTSWAESGPRMYMLGNPAVWWGGLIMLGLWFVAVFMHDILIRRNHHSLTGSLFSTWDEWETFYVIGRILFLGWLLHYIPFFIMARVTYLHHYVPCVIFLALFSGLMTDYFTACLHFWWSKPLAVPMTWSYTYSTHRPLLTHMALLYLSLTIWVFWHFFPLPYGMRGPLTNFSHLQWRPTWHIV